MPTGYHVVDVISLQLLCTNKNVGVVDKDMPPVVKEGEHPVDMSAKDNQVGSRNITVAQAPGEAQPPQQPPVVTKTK